MAKFKFSVSTGYVGSKIEDIVEIPNDELDGLSEVEKEKVIDGYYDEWLQDRVYASWEEVEE